MRDLETIRIALTAAETGHLILSSLHTNDVGQAIHPLVDVFPPAGQSQIRHQLALCLHAIVTQQLLPRCGGRAGHRRSSCSRHTLPVSTSAAKRPEELDRLLR